MTSNFLWQYIAVSAVIILAILRMIYLIRKRSKQKGSCAGCSLAQSCHEYRKPSRGKKANKNVTNSSSAEESTCCTEPKCHCHK